MRRRRGPEREAQTADRWVRITCREREVRITGCVLVTSKYVARIVYCELRIVTSRELRITEREGGDRRSWGNGREVMIAGRASALSGVIVP